MEQIAEQKVSLRVWIDKDKNKVVFVEANGDFVDILLSFLTLPMGTIVKLANSCSDGPQLKPGSLSTLYESVKNIDPKHLSGDQCKDMLINPKNESELLCKKLKINVDDTMPVKYFMCRKCCSYLSTFEDVCSCGELINWKIGVKKDSNVSGGEYEAVFVEESAEFIITDDLCIRESSVGASFKILNYLGVKDMKKIDSLSVSVGLKEVLYLLKLSVLSRTPLTDRFIGNVGKLDIASPRFRFTLSNLGINKDYCQYKVMKLTVMVQRSVQKAAFAQVGEEFIDFLFSILVMPLGSVVSLLGDNSLGSIGNLYNSIGNLNVELVKSRDLKYKLLYPIEAPDYLIESHLHPTIARDGFVSKHAKFMVTDDLVVTPLTSTSCISALKSLKIPISDVVEKQVDIGIGLKALSILEASLKSTTALTELLNMQSAWSECIICDY